jgi:hypothetical protein
MKHIIFKYNSKEATVVSVNPTEISESLVNSFKNELANVCDTIFSISQLSDTLYYAGFEEGTAGARIVEKLIVQLIRDNDRTITPEDLAELLTNIKKASVLVCLSSPTPLHEKLVPVAHVCSVDSTHYGTKIIQNAYGEYLCEDCWIEYIHSAPRGLVEYAISVGKGLTDLAYIPHNNVYDNINDIIAAWKSERDNITILTEAEKIAIEERWETLGYPLT